MKVAFRTTSEIIDATGWALTSPIGFTAVFAANLYPHGFYMRLFTYDSSVYDWCITNFGLRDDLMYDTLTKTTTKTYGSHWCALSDDESVVVAFDDISDTKVTEFMLPFG